MCGVLSVSLLQRQPTPLVLFVGPEKDRLVLGVFAISNKVEKIVNIAADGKIQKIRVNLRGDIFKLRIVVPATVSNFTVSNVSAVISYGKRGE